VPGSGAVIVASNVVPEAQPKIDITASGKLLTGIPGPPDRVAIRSPSPSGTIAHGFVKYAPPLQVNVPVCINGEMSKVIAVQVAVPVFLTAQSFVVTAGVMKLQSLPKVVANEKVLPDIKFVHEFPHVEAV
jgi:hypothetical protein